MFQSMRIDLHTHSTASDGSLTPEALLARATSREVSCISITDHDSVDAYASLQGKRLSSITLIPGIEFSTTWFGRNIHILGLNIDPQNDCLLEGVRQQRQARVDRAQRIASRLGKVGISDLFNKVLRCADGAVIGRPHFAKVLVEEGAVANLKEAYRKYLGNGKPGDVRQFWADMPEVIDWVRVSGGTSVLAHPGLYNLTNTKLTQLAKDFASFGGEAIEVCNGVQSDALTSKLAKLCGDLELAASCGSDFHNGDNNWSEVGKFSPLPATCRPVWENW
jgi:predicted metal-dependent phosphoesterase TrpH